MTDPEDPPLDPQPAWWQWLTVLSLDAPLVAVAWQAFFARLLGVPLRIHHHLLLAAGTWLIYVADRWAEGHAIDPARVLTQRHRFYQRQRWPVAAVAAGVAAGSAALAAFRLTGPEWRFGLALAAPVGAYLAWGPLLRRRGPVRPPKEVQIALLFALGSACFPLVQPGAAPGRLVAPLMLFAALCFCNLALIARWERAVDAAHGQPSLAVSHPEWDRGWRILPWALALGAVPGAVLLAGPAAPACACTSASGILLGLLDQAEPRIGRQAARALVDLALLTPLALPLLPAFR